MASQRATPTTQPQATKLFKFFTRFRRLCQEGSQPTPVSRNAFIAGSVPADSGRVGPSASLESRHSPSDVDVVLVFFYVYYSCSVHIEAGLVLVGIAKNLPAHAQVS